ncbi:acetate/propionate family kinase [Nonomuraea sp. NPDC050536]|uniref:acetate/propionate family kinase n=1 Tax=Nonomuraea sp. NPDC050536 TaxID=3364366 RepID=UPI0037CAC6ED
MILVFNTGSSSVKYELVDLKAGTRPVRGLAELDGALTHRVEGRPPYLREGPFADHAAAFSAALDLLTDVRPSAIGHRVVHGGTRFHGPVLVDDAVMAAIDELAPLAPLHNPVNLAGIRAAATAFPGVPQVAVFDTAFHQSMPPEAYTYAVPREAGARRFGFHGTSCSYATRRAAEILGRPEPDLIVLHLGNGASATAIRAGRSIDTSMGATPTEGLVMGTRSGDVDPYLAAELGAAVLTRRSGLLGLTGASDMREVRRRAELGDPDALLARQVYCYRIRKYVGAYYALLGHVDAIVFTGGVGEHDADIRAAALGGLERLGIQLDPHHNAAHRETISDSDVRVLIIPADEEWEIAHQAATLTG